MLLPLSAPLSGTTWNISKLLRIPGSSQYRILNPITLKITVNHKPHSASTSTTFWSILFYSISKELPTAMIPSNDRFNYYPADALRVRTLLLQVLLILLITFQFWVGKHTRALIAHSQHPQMGMPVTRRCFSFWVFVFGTYGLGSFSSSFASGIFAIWHVSTYWL